MPLQSFLFKGDSQLEAAAVSDQAHIATGQRGEHVRRIQQALQLLDNAQIDKDAIYGMGTANAVLAYKRKRDVINRTYQTAADNVVGRMTVAAMDQELVALETGRPLRLRDLSGRANHLHSQPVSATRFSVTASSSPKGFSSPGGFTPFAFKRHAPNTRGTVTCLNTFFLSEVVCTNTLQDPSYSFPKEMQNKATLLSGLNSAPNAGPDIGDGGRVALTTEPGVMTLQCLHPGDAVIAAKRGNENASLLFIAVRQGKRLKAPGEPLKKLKPGSAYFCDPKAEEPPLVGGVYGGRPVNPRRDRGRMINIGGEGETPEFEDYQVDLRNSMAGDGSFRPWSDDPDPDVFIKNGSAGHITIRSVPLDPDKSNCIKVIKRIAAPGCLLTFSGNGDNEKFIRSIPGRQLELTTTQGTWHGKPTSSIEMAWEISG